jgi:putative copper export protein
VTTWTVIRFLHFVGMAFFVGGQLMLFVAVTPVTRRLGDDAAVRAVAKRFGIGTLVALLVLIATGVAMAGHFHRWDDPTLQAKLGVLVLAGVLIAMHIVTPRTRGLSAGLLVASLLIVWLGVKLAHG